MRLVRKHTTHTRTVSVASGLLALAAACWLLAWQLRSGSTAASWWAQPGSLAGAVAATPGSGQPADCWSWQSVDRLHDRCMAELRAPPFRCCSGAGYACRPCSEALLQALRCVSPRHMLLRLPPGCGAPSVLSAAPPLQTPPPGQPSRQDAQDSCQLSSAAVSGGRWMAATSTPWAGLPGLPGALFEPAGGACSRRRPVVGPAVPRCLQAAGYHRLLVSGDSTVRQLFARLVSVVRQQAVVIDGGGMVHGHYAWQPWPPSAGTTSVLSTDAFWLSPTANHVQGTWNQSIMQAGLERLMHLTSAALSAAPLAEGGGGDGVSAGSGSSSHSRKSHSSSSSSSSSNKRSTGSGGSGASGGPSPAPPLVVDFVVGSRAEWQQRFVRRYLDSQLSNGTAGAAGRTLVLLSLCVWEVGALWPSGWLDFLREVRARVAQVVLLTCPTDRLGTPDKAQALRVVAERNQLLRQMVARSLGGSADSDADGMQEQGSARGRDAPAEGSVAGAGVGRAAGSHRDGAVGVASGRARPLMLLDMDALTQRVSERTTIAPEDYHYQCYLSSDTQYQGGPLAWAGGDGAPLPAYPAMSYDHLRVPVNGMCGDPVNFAAWQLLLSMLCPGITS